MPEVGHSQEDILCKPLKRSESLKAIQIPFLLRRDVFEFVDKEVVNVQVIVQLRELLRIVTHLQDKEVSVYFHLQSDHLKIRRISDILSEE